MRADPLNRVRGRREQIDVGKRAHGVRADPCNRARGRREQIDVGERAHGCGQIHVRGREAGAGRHDNPQTVSRAESMKCVTYQGPGSRSQTTPCQHAGDEVLVHTGWVNMSESRHGAAVESFGLVRQRDRALRNRKAECETLRLEERHREFAPGCPINMLSPHEDENLRVLSTDDIEMS